MTDISRRSFFKKAAIGAATIVVSSNLLTKDKPKLIQYHDFKTASGLSMIYNALGKPKYIGEQKYLKEDGSTYIAISMTQWSRISWEE
jgi:hypothetical protein